LASLSSVKTCQDKISLSAHINVDFPINAFETIFNFSSGNCHFIQASSSEMYSGFSDLRINEETMLNPVSIYGTHKAQVHTFLGNVRKANAALTSSLVLFNNESSIRPETFVSKRIIKQLIELNYGTRTSLVVGNPSIRRDWNHPYDTALAIIKIIDTKSNGDFVIGSGELHSIEDFYTEAASLLGLGKFEVVQDASLFRAQDNDGLSADASKAHEILGWEPSYNFHSIIQEMVNAELNVC
jgi:GDPmannose 4,6-dehydratase